MIVLIIAQEEDPPVLSVCERIKAKGGTPVLFERYRRDHLITYAYQNGKLNPTIEVEGRKLRLDASNITSVWSRVKPIIPGEITGNHCSLTQRFCIQEWRHALQSIMDVLPPETVKWINSPLVNYVMNNKAGQLKLAQSCGLNIPKTIVSNNASDILQFFKNERVVFKSLSSFSTEKGAIYTREVDKERIRLDVDSVAMAPGIYQTLIEKSHELRVTVVNKTCFTIKIESQLSEKSTIDWRQNPEGCPYEAHQLSAETEQKLIQFHQNANLIYASYDFIVNKAGEEIFLECNPNGQWLSFDEIPHLSVADAMANELLQGLQ